MKHLVGAVALVAMFSSSAFALKKAAANTSYAPASTEHKHYISPVLGFMGPGAAVLTDNVNSVDTSRSMVNSGLFGIGADYEFMLKNDFSVGGIFRYYQSDEDYGTGSTAGKTGNSETVFILGPEVKAYVLNSEDFSGYVGTGITILNAKQKVSPPGGASSYTLNPDMTLGFNFVMGIGYKLNSQLTLGIEHRQVLALGSKINGWPVNDYMFRLAIGL